MPPSPKARPSDNKFNPHDLRKEVLRQELAEILSQKSDLGEARKLKVQVERLLEELHHLEEQPGEEPQLTRGVDGEDKTVNPSISISAKEQLQRVYEQIEKIEKLPTAETNEDARLRRMVKRILENDTVERELKLQNQWFYSLRAEKLTPEAADALEIDLHYDRQDNAFRALRNEWALFFLERVTYMRRLAQARSLRIVETLKGEEHIMTKIESELASMNSTRLRLKKLERTFMFSAFRSKSLAYNVLLLQKKRRFLMATWPIRKNLLLIRPAKLMLSFAFRNIRNL